MIVATMLLELNAFMVMNALEVGKQSRTIIRVTFCVTIYSAFCCVPSTGLSNKGVGRTDRLSAPLPEEQYATTLATNTTESGMRVAGIFFSWGSGEKRRSLRLTLGTARTPAINFVLSYFSATHEDVEDCRSV